MENMVITWPVEMDLSCKKVSFAYLK